MHELGLPQKCDHGAEAENVLKLVRYLVELWLEWAELVLFGGAELAGSVAEFLKATTWKEKQT